MSLQKKIRFVHKACTGLFSYCKHTSSGPGVELAIIIERLIAV